MKKDFPVNKKESYTSLRKKMSCLGDLEINAIRKYSKKYIKKNNLKLKNKWYKKCRFLFTCNADMTVWTLIIYYVNSGDLFTSACIVHEMDKDKINKDVAKEICMSRICKLENFISKITNRQSLFTPPIQHIIEPQITNYITAKLTGGVAVRWSELL